MSKNKESKLYYKNRKNFTYLGLIKLNNDCIGCHTAIKKSQVDKNIAVSISLPLINIDGFNKIDITAILLVLSILFIISKVEKSLINKNLLGNIRSKTKVYHWQINWTKKSVKLIISKNQIFSFLQKSLKIDLDIFYDLMGRDFQELIEKLSNRDSISNYEENSIEHKTNFLSFPEWFLTSFYFICGKNGKIKKIVGASVNIEAEKKLA